MSLAPARLARALLPWFDANGRRDLPWQANPTAYRVWVSEVMLQQTQVETVKPYFERFVARFPGPVALSRASVDEVMRLWSGLGYYARARNLHRAARDVVTRFGGGLPETLEGLMTLPGIGRSTAGAILALSRGRRCPILDGNVKRVLARVFLVEQAPNSAAGLKKLWELAEACTPRARVAAYTQAIMDLGATVCTRAKPACARCPLADGCAARAAGRTAEIPAARRRAARRLRHSHLVLVRAGDRVLLLRRPPRGIWGGLWAPPEFPDADAASAFLAERFGAAGPPQRLPPFRHAFTHFDLEIEPWLLEAGDAAGGVAEGEARWHELASIHAVGLPAPVARLLKELRDGPHGSLRNARARGGRPRAPAVPGRARPAHLRERVEGSLAEVARPPEDADQRVPAGAVRAEGAAVPGRGDGEVLLRQRVREARGLRGSGRRRVSD
jgi:A/G-specific adenine glycosylase